MERIKGKAADFIAIAWFGLGFRPRESLVLIGMHGRVSGNVLRVDLPGRREGRALVRDCLARLRGDVDGVFVLVVTETGVRSARAVARQVRTEAAAAGLRVQEVLYVTPTTYRSLLCTDPGCCPPRGRPIADVLACQTAAELVLAGDVVQDCEEALLADVEPLPHPRPQSAPAIDGTGNDAAAWFARWETRLRGTQGWGPLAVPFAVALEDFTLRDAVLASVAGEDETARAFLERRDWDRPVFEQRPDAERMERARELLAEAARSAPPGRRAEALAVLAWMAWHRGDCGARARLLVERALADRPGHRLARIVDDLLACTVPPGWWKPTVSASETRYPPEGR